VFADWKGEWVIVSKHYLGSINHTLLTVEALQKRKVSIRGFIFNGEPNTDTESFLLAYSGLPLLVRLLPETTITLEILNQYAEQWKAHF
jgi:dethiobiotin synthetase